VQHLDLGHTKCSRPKPLRCPLTRIKAVLYPWPNPTYAVESHGVVSLLYPEEGYGFIEASTGEEILSTGRVC
jgi:hypothetical protein